MIIDASVVLSAFFPDESQPQAQLLIRDHLSEKIYLQAPNLLSYELTNAVWQGERRQRIHPAQATEILETIDMLNIRLHQVEWREMMVFTRQYHISAYDGAYLALAKKGDDILITGDKRLYNSVKDEIGWVQLIENYSAVG